MYYEPTKKNYYRYPSSGSLQDHDLKYYFPDNRYATSDTSRYHEPSMSGHAVSAKNDVVKR